MRWLAVPPRRRGLDQVRQGRRLLSVLADFLADSMDWIRMPARKLKTHTPSTAGRCGEEAIHERHDDHTRGGTSPLPLFDTWYSI